jgi:hypothetical protein
VSEQADSHDSASAGLMIKDGTAAGARYAAVAVTPGHGVRIQANFDTDRYAGTGDWLRLTRTGDTVTAAWSADGRTWQQAEIPGGGKLPATAEVGLFVASPPQISVERGPGITSLGMQETEGRAVFDNVTVAGVPPELTGTTIGGELGRTTATSGAFTLTGTGLIGPNSPPDDMVQVSLFGVLAGVLVLVAVGTLVMTSEFKRGLARVTLVADPRRGRMLAAKAVVLGAVAFTAGVVSAVAAFAVAQPLLRTRGWTPPAFPRAELTDPDVLRVLLTTGLFVAAAALLALGVAAITRHSAAAISTVVGLLVLPLLVGSALPAGPARLLLSLTPAAGFATQRAKPPTSALVDPSAMVDPWLGLAVTSLWAAVALVAGAHLLRRRDT